MTRIYLSRPTWTAKSSLFFRKRLLPRGRFQEGDIEARAVWKPMHLQPVFAAAEVVQGRVAERIFANGLCLPSGSNLTSSEQERIVEIVRSCGKA